MNASQKTKVAYFNYIGSIELPAYVVKNFPQIGDCSQYIKECLEIPEVKLELEGLDREELIKELYDYGAWDDEELKVHELNLERILWIGICNIIEEE